MKEAGLEDVVIPIRSDSEVAAAFLREKSFDLVYLDSDHRYGSVSWDLVRFAPLVKPGGLFCGHDCEGKLSDFDPAFLQAGKEKDVHESVHCGTILAVSGFFPDCSINHSIWSVRSVAQNEGWGPTQLSFPDFEDRRQATVPPVGHMGTDKVYRYGKAVFLVPEHLTDADIRDESVRNHPSVISAGNIALLSKKIHKTFRFLPICIGEYKEFNLILRGDEVIGVAQALGPTDLSGTSDSQLETWTNQGLIFFEKTVEKVVREISRAYFGLNLPVKLVEAYQGYNIVVWKEKFFAVAQALGQLDISEIDLSPYEKAGTCFRAGSIDTLKALIDYKLKRETLDE